MTPDTLSIERTKQEIQAIADEILALLKTKELPMWQAHEALKFARVKMDRCTLFK